VKKPPLQFTAFSLMPLCGTTHPDVGLVLQAVLQAPPGSRVPKNEILAFPGAE
jgi:hypothetical protein